MKIPISRQKGSSRRRTPKGSSGRKTPKGSSGRKTPKGSSGRKTNTGAFYNKRDMGNTPRVNNRTRRIRPRTGFKLPKLPKLPKMRIISNNYKNLKSPGNPFFPLGTKVRDKYDPFRWVDPTVAPKKI